jgi:plasmid stability protein
MIRWRNGKRRVSLVTAVAIIALPWDIFDRVPGFTAQPIASKMEDRLATLSVKNLPDGLYRKLKACAKHEQRSVAQEVTALLAQALEPPATLSILGLPGLGKELWHGIDAAAHVASEQSAWR